MPFHNKSGIEIGGPSAVFEQSGFLPIYPIVHSLDGVNFSTSTLWETKLQEGNFYHYGSKTGHQFILEGGNLKEISDNTYDFLLNCNNLEHLANPLSAIFEWKRV